MSESVDLTAQRDAKCIPVAQAVLKMIADTTPLMGEFTFEEGVTAYAPIKEQVSNYLLEQNLKLPEVLYVFKLLRQPLDVVEEKVNGMYNDAIRRAEEKYWGCGEREITLQLLDAKARA